MTSTAGFSIEELSETDVPLMQAVTAFFGEAFEDPETYTSAPPSADYLARLLAGDGFIALAAIKAGTIVGGLTAYELRKFEQQRSEIYIYDVAVAESHRRQGIATALIKRVTEIAADRGAWVVFIQADHDNDPAIALYAKLGTREDAVHFDIRPEPKPDI
ncbi:MAG: AAC(3)-I family aminoglycoside N-acetyltransferase [Alphaproteobacteria bacterium]